RSGWCRTWQLELVAVQVDAAPAWHVASSWTSVRPPRPGPPTCWPAGRPTPSVSACSSSSVATSRPPARHPPAAGRCSSATPTTTLPARSPSPPGRRSPPPRRYGVPGGAAASGSTTSSTPVPRRRPRRSGAARPSPRPPASRPTPPPPPLSSWAAPPRAGSPSVASPPAWSTSSTASSGSAAGPVRWRHDSHPTPFFASPASLLRRTTPRGPRMTHADLVSALWALGRGTGGVALVLFTVSLVLGIVARSGRAVPGLGRFGTSDLHRTAALTGTGLVAAHVGSLLFDPFAQLKVVDL